MRNTKFKNELWMALTGKKEAVSSVSFVFLGNYLGPDYSPLKCKLISPPKKKKKIQLMYNPWDVPMALGLTPLKLNTYFQRSKSDCSSHLITVGHLKNNFVIYFTYQIYR